MGRFMVQSYNKTTPKGCQGPGRPKGGGLVNHHITARHACRQADATVGPGGIRVQAPLPTDGEQHGGGKRGAIHGFSKASMRRMLQILFLIDWSSAPAFWVTLTYHFAPGLTVSGGESVSDSCSRPCSAAPAGLTQSYIAHEQLRAWKERLYRKFGSRLQAGVWKLEYQERGVIHWHVYLFWKRAPRIEAFRAWNDVAWNEISAPWDSVALRGSCSVERVRNTSGPQVAKLMRYLVKYLGKGFTCDEPTGRCWGRWGELPELVLAYLHLDWPALVGYCRRLRKWGRSSRYLSGISPGWGGFLVLGDGWQVMELMRGLGVEPMGDCVSVGVRW